MDNVRIEYPPETAETAPLVCTRIADAVKLKVEHAQLAKWLTDLAEPHVKKHLPAWRVEVAESITSKQLKRECRALTLGGPKIIKLSMSALGKLTREQVENIIMHEIAHGLTHDAGRATRFHHGPAWQDAAKNLGVKFDTRDLVFSDSLNMGLK